ncbi:hypothetical protein [Rhodococcus sp. RCBS9]|uniref:hypothetical protein n=1 Tax=Rhodococcus sp. RCBS9 TaxID=3031999 RepID=UPI00240275F3|nr:hypothetical protein [Rhodococcus sp. RCBS9]WEX02764.1 hypothetical protein P0M12_24410 [Rhodococcus sp. RCBS9]
MADDLKIFISWSGDLAKGVAHVWHDLLREMFDRVTPWVSDIDIEAGARGLDEIKRELDGTLFGIVVVTPENQDAPWLNFEAGALSRSLSEASTRVVPSLVNFSSPTQITSPLKQFQATLLNEDGVARVLKAVAGVVDADWPTKEKAFTRMWPEYQTRFNDKIVESVDPTNPEPRTNQSMLEELLTITRSMQHDLQGTTRFLPGGMLISDGPALSADDARAWLTEYLVTVDIDVIDMKIDTRINGRPIVKLIVADDTPAQVIKNLRAEVEALANITLICEYQGNTNRPPRTKRG